MFENWQSKRKFDHCHSRQFGKSKEHSTIIICDKYPEGIKVKHDQEFSSCTSRTVIAICLGCLGCEYCLEPMTDKIDQVEVDQGGIITETRKFFPNNHLADK